ncbi:TetR/AcrR family transcriptional regulator [Actinopolymorpha pittospori]|uniref:AcrR family transcriptional regulator n=1 Tax=Actinopolymorpha pittospori TaxID=648752 RepID=A0A927MPG2_9ACTN|nr:TetR/AcrR family transcriptional regulator [Actinopolymorpha pittospori]MBE1603986.1 AcrR family transcriptional regulator [Actinopolymorpha pittospori]
MDETKRNRPLRADARRNRARVLDAAESVFAADGLSAAMEDIARTAGVGVGTIYRHFPTKDALFEAIIVNRYERLADDADALSAAKDPGEAFFELFTRMVDQAAAQKAFADPLAQAGVDIKASTSAIGQRLLAALERLLIQAQQARAVRDDVGLPEVIAVLSGSCHAAEYAGRDHSVRARALAIVFDGLAPPR